MDILSFLTFIKTKKAKKHTSQAFTLIEILVVMSVLAIMSSILVGYSRNNSKRFLLTSTEARIVSMFSRAKFLSIETFFKEYGSTGSMRQICSYGVHVDEPSQEIFIFQDRAPIGAECPSNNIYDQGNDVRLLGDLNEMTLDSNIILIDRNKTDLKNVVFIPPNPDVKLNNGDASRSINIKLADGSDSFTVTVTKAGQMKTR